MASSSDMENPRMLKEAKIVVGLDFGTTFSGFAYALRADIDTIYTFYDWPKQAASGGMPYCKTQTSLLYADANDVSSTDLFTLRDWGWPALVKYKSTNASVASTNDSVHGSNFRVEQEEDDDLQPVIEHVGVSSLSGFSKSKTSVTMKQAGHRSCSSGSGDFLTLCKLNLASKDPSIPADEDSVSRARPILPPGMTANRAITDYLSRISKFIHRELRNKFGTHITLDDVQWCLTVPAVWDEHSKREFRHCTEIAELVRGPNSKKAGSPYPLKLFIARASVFCQLKLKDHSWKKGDKFLVVDCGGSRVQNFEENLW